MTYIFWAFILSILTSPVSLLTDSYLQMDLSFLISIAVFGLLLKGLSTLNKTQRNFQNVKIFTILLLGISIVSGVVVLVKDSNVSGGVGFVMMGSGIISILNEYHLIKGIQSYAPVLTVPQETVRLLKYWKINLISSIVMGFTVVITGIVIGFSYALSVGNSTDVIDLNTFVSDPQALLDTLKPNAPILIVLLVILAGTIMVGFTSRILWLVTLNKLRKDHQQVLQKEPIVLAVE
jgi:hypothetical protein